MTHKNIQRHFLGKLFDMTDVYFFFLLITILDTQHRSDELYLFYYYSNLLTMQ